MGRVKTFTGGGSLLPGDLNGMEDDYESAFSSYKSIRHAAGFANWSAGGILRPGGGNNYAGVFYFDPAAYGASPRTVYLSIRAILAVNQVAPATNLRIGLYPVNFAAGTSGNPNGYTLGTLVAGSQASFTTPAASSLNNASSADFAAPSAGFYCLGNKADAGLAAGSFCETNARLLVRQV